MKGEGWGVFWLTLPFQIMLIVIGVVYFTKAPKEAMFVIFGLAFVLFCWAMAERAMDRL